jgi:hypothetical protein
MAMSVISSPAPLATPAATATPSLQALTATSSSIPSPVPLVAPAVADTASPPAPRCLNLSSQLLAAAPSRSYQPCASLLASSSPVAGHQSPTHSCAVGRSTSISPISSEKLDSGSIDAEDGAYGLHCFLLATAVCAPATSKPGDSNDGAIAALIPP